MLKSLNTVKYLALAGFLFVSQAVMALQLVPMGLELTASGQGATGLVRVSNSSDKPEAVEVYVTTRDPDVNGTENNNQEDEENFLVYPPQVIVPANSEQVVRITWIGDPNPKTELAFRLVAAQVPVDVPDPSKSEVQKSKKMGAAVTIMFRYEAALYITPDWVKPKVVIESAMEELSDDGQPLLSVVFHNEGTQHSFLRNLEVTLTSEEDPSLSVTLKGEELKGVLGQNLLAGSRRRFVASWPDTLPKGKVKATFVTESV